MPLESDGHTAPFRGLRGGYVDRSLYVLPLSSPVRRGIICLAESRAFRGFSMLAIVAYAAVLGAYQPGAPEEDPRNKFIVNSNIGFTAWFTLELAVKIMAFGLVLKDGETVAGALAAVVRGAAMLVHMVVGPRDKAGGEEGEEDDGGLGAGEPPSLEMVGGAALNGGRDVEMGRSPDGGERRRRSGGGARRAAGQSGGGRGLSDDAASSGELDDCDLGDGGSLALAPEPSITTTLCEDEEAGGSRAADVQLPFLREPFNVFDGFIVLLSLLSFIQGVGAAASALRAFRLLLPLRAVSTLPNMRTSIRALASAVPALSTIAAGILFIIVLWGVMGMQLFQPSMHNNCFQLAPDPSAPAGASNATSWQTTEDTCSLFNGPWKGAECPSGQECRPGGVAPEGGALSFDNFGASIVPIYITMTAAGWSSVLRPTMNATAGWSYFYFITLLIVGYVLVLSLVLATLADAFLEEQQREKAEQLAAGEQPPSALSVALRSFLGRLSSWYWHPLPCTCGPNGPSRAQQLLEKATDHWAFEALVIAAVLANTVVLSMQYDGMSQRYAAGLEKVNDVLSFVFLAEAVIKIAAKGRKYFVSAFNIFDFVVSVLSVMSVFVSAANGIGALRAVRVLRVLRLLTVLPSLQKCMIVLGRVVASSLPFFLLVFFLYYVFALLGMQLFGETCGPESATAPTFGFTSLWEALLAVFTLSLGDVGDIFSMMDCASGAAAVYYIAVAVCGDMVLLNLLVGVMYSVFAEEQDTLVTPSEGPTIVQRLRWLVGRSANLVRSASSAVLPGGKKRHSHNNHHRHTGGTDQNEGRHHHPSHGDRADNHQKQASGDVVEAPTASAAAPGAAAANGGGAGSSARRPPPGTPPPPESLASTGGGDSDEFDGGSEQGDGAAAAPGQQQNLVRRATTLVREGHAQAFVRDLVTATSSRWKGAVGAPLVEFQGDSFWLLPPSSPARRLAFSIIDDNRFEAFILLIIVANCVAMGIETPGNPEGTARILWALEVSFLAIYTVEMLLKMTALGAVRGPRAYFKSPWNWLDFIIVVTSIAGELTASLGWISVLRTLRVLRALRLLSRVPEVKAVFSCLGSSVLKTGNMLVVAFVIMVIFAIVGMEMFQGSLHGCVSAATGELTDQCCSDPLNPATCADVTARAQCAGFLPASGGPGDAGDPDTCHWLPLPFNFDNLWNSLVTLSILMTGNSFGAAASTGMSAVGPGMQPQRHASAWAASYYLMFTLVGFVFLLNFLVCIILDNYAKEAREHGTGLMLTEKQRAWVDAQRVLLRTTRAQKSAPPAPRSAVRRWLLKVTGARLFEVAVMAAVLLNTVFMMVEHYSQPPGWDDALQMASTVFTVMFCVESALKITAQGPAAYFSNGWNILDFLVSWGSVPGIFITAGPGANVLRTLRIARVLTLMRRIPSVRRLMMTMYLSVPTIGNMLLLILLLLYTFAVLGVNLFYGNGDQNFDQFFNWNNVGAAMMMLSLVATGDWDGFMRSTAVSPPFCDASVPHACSPHPVLAEVYFLAFTVLLFVVVLNIVIGVVVEAMAMSKELPEVPPENFAQYQRVWVRLDPSGRGFLDTDQLSVLLSRLDAPLGFKGSGRSPSDCMASLKDLEVDDEGLVYYHQVLQVLTARAAGVSIDELSPEVRGQLKERTEALKRQYKQLIKKRQAEAAKRTRSAPATPPPAARSGAATPPPPPAPASRATSRSNSGAGAAAAAGAGARAVM